MIDSNHAEQPSPADYMWSVAELTAWIGVGAVFITLAWGSVGLVRELAGHGPWGWAGVVIVTLFALMAALLSAWSYLWYIEVASDSWNDLVHGPHSDGRSIAVAVAGYLLVASVTVGLTALWTRWESPWRWLVLSVLGSMLISNGISSMFMRTKYGTR